jgi:hypothetical protein
MTTWDYDLAFTMQQQLQTEWCWAATSTSVSLFYDAVNSPWTQCKVVNAEQSQTTCCQNGASAACNVPWYLDKALTRTKNFNYYVSNSLSISDLDLELANGRPMGTRIGWAGGGGHFMVLGGASTKDSRVHVHDPIYGDQDYDYNSYCTKYQGNGTWTHSYYTQTFKNPASGCITLLVQLLFGARKQELSAAQPKVTGVNVSHPVFFERLDDLAGGKGLSAAQESGRWNIVVAQSGDVYAEDTEPGSTAVRSVIRGPLVTETLRLVDEVRRQNLSENIPRETRLLQIPGIYVFALWLKAPQDGDDLLMPMKPAPTALRAGVAYARSEFEAIVKPLAEARLRFDERPGPER